MTTKITLRRDYGETHVRKLDGYTVKIKLDPGAYYRCRVYRSRRNVWEGIVAPPVMFAACGLFGTPDNIGQAAIDAVFAARGF